MTTGYRQIDEAARERVRARLMARPPEPIAALLSQCRVDEQDEPIAERVLTELAGLVGVAPGHLRHEDVFGELFRVHLHELGSQVAAIDWAKAGLAEYIEVFGYDIMHLVEKLSTQSGWKKIRERISPRPANEEEWIDAFMAMTLGEFIRCSVGMMKG